MLTFLVWVKKKSNNYENRSIERLVSPLMICHLSKNMLIYFAVCFLPQAEGEPSWLHFKRQHQFPDNTVTLKSI